MSIHFNRVSFGDSHGRLRATPPTLLGRLLASVAGMGLLVVLFAASLVVFALAFTVGLLTWGYLMWKARTLRQMLQQQMRTPMNADASTDASAGVPGGRLIEGQVIRERPPGKDRP